MSIKLNQLTNIVDKIMAKVKDKTDAIEKDIKEVSSQIDEIATTGTTVETVQNTVKELAEAGEIQAYTIADKSIDASNKIIDGSITQELIGKEEITKDKLDNNIIGNKIYVNKIGAYTGIGLIPSNVKSGNEIKINFKIIPLNITSKLRVLVNFAGSYKEKTFSVTLNEENYIECIINDTRTINTIAIGTNSSSPSAKFEAYIEDLIVMLDSKVIKFNKIEESTEENQIVTDLSEKDFILASKKFTNDKLRDLKENFSYNQESINFEALNKNSLLGRTFYYKNDTPITYAGFTLKLKEPIPITNLVIKFKTKIIKSYGAGMFIKYLQTNGSIYNVNFIEKPKLNMFNNVETNPINKDNIGIKTINICINSNAVGLAEFYVEDIYIEAGGKRYAEYELVENDNVTELSTVPDFLATKSYVSSNIKEAISSPTKKTIELPIPNNIYTVCNPNREYALPFCIDYQYWDIDNKILFKNGLDINYIKSLIDQDNDIVSNQETFTLISDYYDVGDITINNISTKSSAKNKKLIVLIIGDSVTAGAITRMQYWAKAAEFFEMEAIENKQETSNIIFVGKNNNKTISVNFNGEERSIKASACGVSSWSLSNWLGTISEANGFTYEDSNNEVVFSFNKFIERYRTLDDNGVQLYGNSGKQAYYDKELTKIAEGYTIGTKITSDNIETIRCCKPNTIIVNSTHNGGSNEQIEEIFYIAKNELGSDTVCIDANPMPLIGTWNPELYTDKTWVNRVYQKPNQYSNYAKGRIDQAKYFIEKEKSGEDNNFYLYPLHWITPTLDALEYSEVEVLGSDKKLKRITTQAMPYIHPGTNCHKIWGYELYALLKYIAVK